MTTPGALTKARILRAATTEFAAHGFAGARIDRIAEAAAVNKERLYAHVGDKLALFRAVVEANLVDLGTNIALDAGDLAESAGRIFDHITAHPEHLRILDWARLEGIDGVDGIVERAGLGDPDGSGWPDLPDQLGSVADAQRAGTVRRDVPPADVVISLFAIASGWLHAPAYFTANTAEPHAARRAYVVDAVRRLLSP